MSHQFEGYTPTWCSGCGDWPIRISIINALKELGLTPSDVFIVFDIGCSGNMNDFLNAYAIHSLHGRAIPQAIGAKIANHTMPVIAIGGDGATYGEGGNHFLHAVRGNHDITLIVHDNSLYGLTTGQTAPTTHEGIKTKSTPFGAPEKAINPLTLALTQGATFIGQGFSANVPHLTSVISAALKHKGFSLVNVLQPCVTFNRTNTYHYYMERVKYLDESYNSSDFVSALKTTLAMDYEEFYAGVLYEAQKPTFTDHYPQLHEKPLVKKEPYTDIEKLLEPYV